MVSLVIAAYNMQDYITEALDSAFNQDYLGNMEVIVVNDGSTDNTLGVVQSHPKASYIKIINQINRGLASVRNSGIMASSGEKIVFLDADDILCPNFVRETERWCGADIAIVHTDYETFGNATKLRVPHISHRCDTNLAMMCTSNMINTNSMFLKEALVECGGYNSNMNKGYEDWNLCLDILKRGWKNKHVPIIGYKYRIRENSMIEGIVNHHHIPMVEQMKKNHPDLDLHGIDMLTNFMKERGFFGRL